MSQAKLDSTPIQLPAAADYSAKLFRFGKIVSGQAAVCSVAGERADGILGAHYVKSPSAGDGIDFYIDRVMLVEAGAAFSAGDDLATDANGKAQTATAGQHVNAIAIDAATAAGQYVRVRSPYSKAPSAENVSNAQTGPGTLVTYVFDIADAASADYDRVVSEKIEVLDVVVQKRGGAGGAADTVTVKSGANAISDAIDTNIADKTLARAATVDDANSTIAAAGTLRVSVNNGAAGNAAVLVTVLAIKRA